MNDPYEDFLPPLDDSPESDEGRREFLRKAGLAGAVAAGAAVGGPLLGATAAHAAPVGGGIPPSAKAAALLPSIGQRIKCSCNAFGADLVVSDLGPGFPSVKFVGQIVVEVILGGLDFVYLKVHDHTLRAENVPGFKTITIRLPDIGGPVLSTLRVLGNGGLLQTMLLTFWVEFAECFGCVGPFRFQTLQAAELVANLLPNQFPPRGVEYALKAPIKIGKIGGGPGSPQYARLENFNVMVDHISTS